MRILGWEITLKKLPERKKRARGHSSRKWTDSEIRTMFRMINEGYSQHDIGINLKRTTAAIYTKLNKIRKENKYESYKMGALADEQARRAQEEK